MATFFAPAVDLEAGFAADLDATLDPTFVEDFEAVLAGAFVGFFLAAVLLGTLSSGVNERRGTTSIDLASTRVWVGSPWLG